MYDIYIHIHIYTHTYKYIYTHICIYEIRPCGFFVKSTALICRAGSRKKRSAVNVLRSHTNGELPNSPLPLPPPLTPPPLPSPGGYSQIS